MKIDWRHIDIKDLAAVVSEKLREKGIDAILVGGACVSIYTKNKYLSSDLDFISHASLKEISSALSELGFKRESSRHFVRKDCPFFYRNCCSTRCDRKRANKIEKRDKNKVR